jgi:nucleotide-binding universal stress UspA family protein
MQQKPIEAIAHPTDFSQASAEAFAHALRLAVEFRCRLDLVHVRSQSSETWSSFPRVRQTLARWGFLEEDATHAEVEKSLGVGIRKIAIEHAHPLQGVAEFLISHRPDLVVMATHGAQGWSRWLSESVSEGIASKTHIPALFIGPKARSFVDPKSGRMHLKSALIPVARKPAPQRALLRWRDMFKSLPMSERFVHAGEPPFELAAAEGGKLKVHILQGPAVEAILAEASSSLADLLVMPTAGHNGFLDALRGSTTQQVVHRAPCPVLALPL